MSEERPSLHNNHLQRLQQRYNLWGALATSDMGVIDDRLDLRTSTDIRSHSRSTVLVGKVFDRAQTLLADVLEPGSCQE